MKLTKHFDSSEFRCKCGCGVENVDKRLVEKLETLRERLNASAIIISSGFRCPNHDRAVGGSGCGMHTLGGAVDIMALKEDKNPYTSLTVAEVSESVGFTGIGIIDNIYTHLDIRGTIPYINNLWFGNEKTGATYKTFKGMGEKIETKTDREIKVILEYENHKYSGLLSEME